MSKSGRREQGMALKAGRKERLGKSRMLSRSRRGESQAPELGSHGPHHSDIQRVPMLSLKRELVDAHIKK